MARPPALSLSDFETDDHSILQQLKTPQPAHTLIDFAKSHGLRVTSGYSKGGHNAGSRHYQGNENDPGAIDIDHRNVDYNKLLAWAGQNGFSVHDERSRPKGQAVWGGPHYHIQKGSSPSKAPKIREISGVSAQSGPVKVGPVNLTMPITTDADGNLVFNQAPATPRIDLSKALKPTPKKTVAEPVGLEDFDLTPEDMAEVQAVAARLKPKAEPVAQPAKPKDPTFMEGVGNVLNAGGQMLSQIPGAFQKEMQAAQANPIFNQDEMRAAALTGMASAPTDIINLITQTPAAIGNAWEGRQKYSPLLPEVYGARDIPGLKEITERHPVADFMGGAAVPVDLGLGALAKAKGAGKATKAIESVTPPKPIEAPPQPSVFHDIAIAEQAKNAALSKQREIEAAIPTQPAKPYQSQADIINRLAEIENGNPAKSALSKRIQDAEAKIEARALDEVGFKQYEADRSKLKELQTAVSDVDAASQKLTELSTPVKRSELPQVKMQEVMDQGVNPSTLKALDQRMEGQLSKLDNEGRSIEAPKATQEFPVTREIAAPRFADEVTTLDKAGQPNPAPFESKVRELPTAEAQLADAPKAVDTPSNQPSGNVFRTPEGGEVYTHGRDVADIQRQLAESSGQIAKIADIERHLQVHNPDAVPAIRNILNAGKNSEAAKFSYIAREAPGEPARVRDNFVPTHFTFETISPATQRGFLRRKYGSDEAAISHLKQEIVSRGGSVDAATLQTKGGKDIAPATQISRLITALDNQTGGAYLKSPRVHGINLGETTRSAAGDRGIRLDTITDSSLTGRKVTPDQLQGHSYKNQIAPALKALDDLATSAQSSVFKRAVKQIQKGEISGKTMRELKAALADKDLAAKFCNVFGVKL